MPGTTPFEAQELQPGIWALDEGFVRCYLIIGSEKALLLDTGAAGDGLRDIVSSLTSLPLQVALTHTDGDHTGCLHEFAHFAMHPNEKPYILQKHPDWDRPFTPLAEGDTLDLGGRILRVLHIPGHTPGSIALLDEQNALLFSGDTVSESPIFMFAPGRDLPTFITSLQRLDALRPAYTCVFPCHGPTPIGADILPELVEGARRLQDGQMPPP